MTAIRKSVVDHGADDGLTPTWRPLRIAMIGQKGLPATFGGIEHHVEEVGRRLAARGHEVTVFCRRSYGHVDGTSYRGMELRMAPTIGTKHLDAIVHSGTSTALALAGHFDVVHYHGLGPGLLSPLPRYLAHTAVVQTVHGLDNERAKWGLGARTILGSAHWLSGHVPNRTIVVSRSLGDSYRSELHRSCDYIPNGVDEPAELPPQRIVETLGLEPDRYLLFVGRFVPEKAPDLLLRAYRKVPGDLSLVMVGDSSFTDGYTAQLKELAAGDHRVRFTGFVYGDLLHELYRYAHLFVQPSLLEGLPLTLLEAASYGRPVVASDIPPHREVIGVSGPGRRMFRSGDEVALVTALAQALRDEPAELPGADLLRQQVRAGYQWDAAVTELEHLYLEVAAPPQRLGRPRRFGRSLAARRLASAGTALMMLGGVGLATSCSTGVADASSRVSAISSAAPTTPTPIASTTPPVGLSAALSSANRAVTTALFTLAERSRTLSDDKSLATARKTAAGGLADARRYLALERNEAYSAGTSCRSVTSYASSTRAAYGRVLSGRSAALAASARVRTEVAELDQATAAVAKALSLLRSAAAGEPTGGSASATDVEAALTSAKALHASAVSDMADTESKTSAAVAAAGKAAASAAVIAGKAC